MIALRIGLLNGTAGSVGAVGTGGAPPGVEEARPPVGGDVSSNGRPARRPNAGGGPPTDQDPGP